ncbi:D-cysteine desulfhydrase family protein [Streptomyces sp. BP-8]|uniref:D-cysteine desulfhydrase family protein n=1 Tax=Streptomyces sirii TaxID=3127701 RepID=A0ABZ2QIJ4_9ACTN
MPVAHTSFVPFATPVEPLDRLGERLGLRRGSLWVKRDDLTGLSGGGNKARKLEYLCARVASQGWRTLVATGGPQSNLARSVAAAAARLGLDCHLILAGEPPTRPSGNLILDDLMGATVEWTGRPLSLDAAEQAVHAAAARLTAEGKPAYPIPFGGSSPLGCQGYLHAARELREQLPGVQLVVTATGSGGTQAGLAAGLGSHDHVLGIRVTPFTDLAGRVHDLADATAQTAGTPAPRGRVQLDDSQLGEGYGIPTDACLEAIRYTARHTGLILDPTYTGKAMAGLIAAVHEGRITSGMTTVFLHTGGLPGLFGDSHSSHWKVPGSAGPAPA